MMVMCSEHLSDVIMISQSFTAMSSRITGITVSAKIIITDISYNVITVRHHPGVIS